VTRSTGPIRSQHRFPPESLHDIVGHDGAMRHLMRRFDSGDHDTPLLIYGPEGVGKAALARMYAKALFCTDPRPDPSQCCECVSCRSFETQAPFGLIDFDAATVERPREVFAEKLQHMAILDRRVVIARNVQRAAAQLVDALLKRMEKGDKKGTQQHVDVKTTFILLTEDLAGVRSAGQSRCIVQRLKPLDDRNARNFARIVLRSMDVDLKGEPFEALLAGCNGLPGLIAKACSSIRENGRPDTASVARILKIDWGPTVIDYLIQLLNRNAIAADLAVRSGLEPSDLSAGIRNVLSHLPPFIADGHHRMSEAKTFKILPSDKMRQLAACWRKCAEMQGLPALQLWAAVSDLYLREVLDNPVGVERVARDARALMVDRRNAAGP
jgi:hypothetical protein